MGEVLVVYKIMPLDEGIEIKELKSRIASIIPKNVRLERINEKAIAFGLTALEVVLVMKDEEGQTEIVEKALNSVEGIGSVEATDVSRLL
ncbi:MAG: elongation factor 1-beta [Candidatus Thermoplasmatota archaeon]